MPNDKIIVELAGGHGVGKSTIAPLLAKRLREHFGSRLVAAMPEIGVVWQRRKWSRWKRRCWLASHPKFLMLAMRTGLAREWLQVYSTLGLARRSLQKGCRIALIDQGLLRIARYPREIETFPKKYLPNLVIQLTADPATVALRRLLRDKKIHSLQRGIARETHGCEIRGELEGLPTHLVEQGMRAYAKKFCDPPLDEKNRSKTLREPQPGSSALQKRAWTLRTGCYGEPSFARNTGRNHRQFAQSNFGELCEGVFSEDCFSVAQARSVTFDPINPFNERIRSRP